jgi:hypothetical protein
LVLELPETARQADGRWYAQGVVQRNDLDFSEPAVTGPNTGDAP